LGFHRHRLGRVHGRVCARMGDVTQHCTGRERPALYFSGTHMSRRDLQKAYQPNLVKGQGVTCALALVVALGLSVLDTYSVRPGGTGDVAGHRDGVRKPDGKRKDFGNAAGAGLPVGSGFLGFGVRFKVIPADTSNVAPARYAEAVSQNTQTTGPDLGSELGLPPGWALDAAMDTSSDYGLPKDCSALVRFLPTPNWPDARLRGRRPLDHPTQIDMAAVQWPQNRHARRTSGVASLLLLINRRGGIDSCAITMDAPTGCGFAEALRDAVYASRIVPEVREGRSVSSRIEITYDFVYSATQPQTSLRTEGSVHVSYPGLR
jgi:hypothetical protein